MKICKSMLKTELGVVYLFANDTALLGLYFDSNLIKADQRFAQLEIIRDSNPIIEMAEKQLQEFFAGTRKNFELPIVFKGSHFEQSVWKSLLKIPYGEIISYLKQAETINQKKAVRAVASANGRNPFPIIFPCHRVIRSDGTLGGYSGGLKIKEALLRIELKTLKIAGWSKSPYARPQE
jgi:methylated-DNA-[protein]-cysteine S-methyltransferase